MKYKFILALLLLSACATPYKADGIFGGYSEKKVSDNTFHVQFLANGFTPDSDAAKMLFRRIGEVCLGNGYKYYGFLNSPAKQPQITGKPQPLSLVSSSFGDGPRLLSVTVYFLKTHQPDENFIFACDNPTNQ